MDGDGDIDLVVGESGGSLKYYRQETSGFAERTGGNNPFNSIDVGTYSTPTFTDISGDGKPDLVVGRASVSLSLNYYLNESTNGTIVFTPKTGDQNPFRNETTHSTPTFADIDGDGKLDLVVGSQRGTLSYHLNESSGGNITFTKKLNTDNPFYRIDVGDYSAPAFADINGDDEIDLVVGERDRILNYYLNESTNSETIFTDNTKNSSPFHIDVGTYSVPTFADINGNGKKDLVVGKESNHNLSYYLNESSSSTIEFNPQTGLTILHDKFSTPTFADIDGDGKPDLVIGNISGTVSYYQNRSSGSTIRFDGTGGNSNPFNSIDLESRSAPAFADIDGDGDLDLIVGKGDGTLNYYQNRSSVSTIRFVSKDRRR